MHTATPSLASLLPGFEHRLPRPWTLEDDALGTLEVLAYGHGYAARADWELTSRYALTLAGGAVEAEVLVHSRPDLSTTDPETGGPGYEVLEEARTPAGDPLPLRGEAWALIRRALEAFEADLAEWEAADAQMGDPYP